MVSPFNITKRSYSTAVYNSAAEEKRKLANLKRKHITPLEKSGLNNRTILCTLDVETGKIFGDLQYPIAISFAYHHYKVKSFMVTIDKNKVQNPETSLEAVNDMWIQLFNIIKNHKDLRNKL